MRLLNSRFINLARVAADLMEHLDSPDSFFFEGFRLDRRGLFWVDETGQTEPISRALDLLLLLADRQGELVPNLSRFARLRARATKRCSPTRNRWWS